MMRDGVKRYVRTGVSSGFGTVKVLLAAGMDVEPALQAAEAMTLEAMDRQIDRALRGKPASEITQHLAHLDARVRNRVTRSRKRTPEKA